MIVGSGLPVREEDNRPACWGCDVSSLTMVKVGQKGMDAISYV